ALAQVEKDPDDSRGWFQLGMIYERRAAYLDSLDAYVKMQAAVVKLENTQKRRYTGGLYKIGETLVRLRRYPDAKVYLGKVVRIMDFGAFVEIRRGTDGLVHISQLANHRVKNVRDEVKEGDEIKVKVLEVDRQGKIRLSRKELLPKEEPAKTE
ncbi:MAG: S1 RNA-binding domain-containing protein, partial [Nitrospirota bacterium]|nr:S1 RNA-binding domain-containing protein [Nitrospirota bacterium]